MKKIFIIGAGMLILLTACKTNRTDDENLEKLLDRQAEIKKDQEESIEQMERLKDSLNIEKRTLLNQRESKDLQIQQMEMNQKQLADKLKEEEANTVSAQKADLEEQIDRYEDSISGLKKEIGEFDTRLDSIEENLNFYVAQETRTVRTFDSGIEEIDQRMNQREQRKQLETKQIELLHKRVLVAEKKIEAYNLERQLYVEQQDEMFREKASEEAMRPYKERIVKMDSIIAAEKANKNSIELEIKKSEKFITETDEIMNDLQNQIKEEYNRKDIIESFIAAEKERLKSELQQIKDTRKALVDQQEDISGNLARTKVQIERMDRDVELIKSKKMSDILESQAEIENTEAGLAEEEISLLKTGSGRTSIPAVTADSPDTSLQTIVNFGYQLDSLNDLIKEEKAEIAKTRKELSEKRAEAAHQRAKFGRTVGISVVILIIAGIALLGLFYYLGRNSRKS